MKSERSLALVSTTNRYLKALCFFQLTSTNQEEAHRSRVSFKRFVSRWIRLVSRWIRLVVAYIYPTSLGHVRHSFHRPNTNHSDSLHTSDGALICFALMSHRRVVCMGNLVFCCTHRNLSVHRPNTNHSDSLHTSDGALICFALMSHCRAVCRGNLVFCCTNRNLSVHRPNTNHLDSLPTSDGALICFALMHEPPSGCMQGKPCVLFVLIPHTY